VNCEQKTTQVVVLGTGGTIAGTAASPSDNLGYTAAQVGVSDLLAQLPGLSSVLGEHCLCSEQVGQVDSKDMSFALWQRLLLRVRHHLAQPQVCGVVVTHGTDTLEETAYFLHAALTAAGLLQKPVVLTCAMRPASALSPDGPQNLLDSVCTVLSPGACGVMVVCAGVLHSALDVQKNHTYRLDAFGSGDGGPLGYLEEGSLRLTRNWLVAPVNRALTAINFEDAALAWPRVEVLLNYAGCDGVLVRALLQVSSATSPLRGLVLAGTGNGTLHQEMERALLDARDAGVSVWRATRCANGRVLPVASAVFPDSRGLSAVKARIALMLELMAQDAARALG